MIPATKERPVAVKYSLSLPSELRERIDRFVARENERIAPARLPINSLLVTAIAEYLDRRESRDGVLS